MIQVLWGRRWGNNEDVWRCINELKNIKDRELGGFVKLIRRGFTKNDGTFTIDATDFALRQFCFARSPNGDTRWSVWWTEWPTETECQVCHGACVVWNKHPSMPTTEAAFRWLKFFPNMFSKWEVCVYIYTYLVGGFKHFFHNIWDNPSHWLIFFKMVLKPPTIYIYMSISTDHAISWPFPMVSLRERKCWENPQDPSFFLDKALWCLFYPIDMYMIWVTHKIVAIIYCNTNLVLLRLGLAKGCAKPSLRDDPIPIPLFCMSRLKVCERRNPHDPNYLICAWRWTWTSNFVRYIYIYVYNKVWSYICIFIYAL